MFVQFKIKVHWYSKTSLMQHVCSSKILHGSWIDRWNSNTKYETEKIKKKKKLEYFQVCNM